MPVIALGIPTVVETAVLVNDCLDLLIEKLQEEAKSNDMLNKIKQEDNYKEIKRSINAKRVQPNSHTKRNRRLNRKYERRCSYGN